MRGVILLLGLTLTTTTFSAYHTQGWQWYNEVVIEDDIDKEEPPVPTMSYTQQMAEFHAYHKEAHDKAVITQDVEDVAYAARLNQWMMEQSKGYGRAMKQALLKYPNLSHELKFPTAQVARQVAYQEQKKEQTRAISRLSKQYGLFYFYRGGNPYDQKMAQSVQDLADEYQIALIGFAVDGKALPEIKNNQHHRNQMQSLEVKALPALFLVDPKAKKSQPLAYGFVAQDEVKQHYVDIATQYGEEKI
jgi:conjugal transfer pilus assembly protein TraF